MKKALVLLVSVCLPMIFCAFKMKEQSDHFKTYYPSGALKAEFPQKSGRLEGETIWYYESGAIGAVLNYKNNRLHGPTRTFYEDGTLKKEIQHENNLPVGKAKHYHRSGALSYEDVYHSGKLTLRWHFLENGAMNYCEELVRGVSPYSLVGVEKTDFSL